MISCDPSDLANVARCWSACIPDQLAVRSYLLCQKASGAGTPVCATPNLEQVLDIDGSSAQVTWKKNPLNTVPVTGWTVFWGTTAGGPYTSNSGVLPPTPTQYTATGLTGLTTYYFVVEQLTADPTCDRTSNERSLTTSCAFSAAVCDWALRVVANGDPRPSDTILAAYDTWYNAVVAAGIDGKIIANCWLNAKPGTIITNTTPLFHTFGTDPWGKGADVVAGDFGVNGFTGNPAQPNKYLTTGVIPSTAFPSANSAGFAVYNYSEPGLNGGFYAGCSQAANLNLYESPRYIGGGSGYFFTCFFGGADFIQWNTGGDGAAGDGFNGWISSQRTAVNSWNVYAARSTFPHASVGSSVNGPGNRTVGFDIYVLSANIAGTPQTSKDATLSFAIAVQGLTSAEDAALFNATQALLVTAGGGFR